VTLIADGPLGGDCTHTGCVPSKTLIAAAARGDDFATAMSAVHATVDRIAASEDEAHLAAAGVTVVRGRALLAGGGRVVVDGTTFTSDRIIVSTGARASVPPVPGLADLDPLTNETVFSLTKLPESLLVVGGGPIGCELSQAFARLGSAITIVDMAPRVLPNDDPEASTVIADALARDGVRMHLGAGLERAEAVDGRYRLHLAGGVSVEGATLLVAAGRRAVTGGLGAEDVGLELDRGGRIVVDETCATSVPGIWAVGDVTQFGGFTHVAGHMAYVAARNATRTSRFAPKAKINTRVVPRVTFTDPEVAQVGMTEHEAAEHGGRVAYLPLDRVDRAITAGRTEGFVKLIAGPRKVLGSVGGGQILGATIVAPGAGELIHEAVLAMQTRMFAGRLAQTTHAYPTWSMAIQQAATQFYFATDDLEARPAQPST
jgi:pyruvate/2-oxoglutarate dehydrogenase complex dihydrolipoamide dehydrogenase (E3) component